MIYRGRNITVGTAGQTEEIAVTKQTSGLIFV